MIYAKMNKAVLVATLVERDALIAARNAEIEAMRKELSVARFHAPKSAESRGRLEYKPVSAADMWKTMQVARELAMSTGKTQLAYTQPR